MPPNTEEQKKTSKRNKKHEPGALSPTTEDTNAMKTHTEETPSNSNPFINKPDAEEHKTHRAATDADGHEAVEAAQREVQVRHAKREVQLAHLRTIKNRTVRNQVAKELGFETAVGQSVLRSMAETATEIAIIASGAAIATVAIMIVVKAVAGGNSNVVALPAPAGTEAMAA